jgi:hypothetical protein
MSLLTHGGVALPTVAVLGEKTSFHFSFQESSDCQLIDFFLARKSRAVL